jgi:hypothetical protein
MEELGLRKQGAKHILPYAVEGPGPLKCTLKFQAPNQGLSIFPSPMFIQDILK